MKAIKNKKFSFIADEIARLEGYLGEFTAGLEGILRRAVEDTLMAGGKRIRPALFFICSMGDFYDTDYLLPAAASIELLHTASLIHDDIIDKARFRRGRETIHSIFDLDTAKYAGNYLFTCTFSMLNKYENPRILKEVSAAAQNLVKGEFDQIKTKKVLKQGEKMYFKKISEKTSSLFRFSCILGGILSNSSEAIITKLGKFGAYLGTSFQINDDLLDLDSRKNDVNIGKLTGNDVKQGNVTLPIIYALKDPLFRSRINRIFRQDVISRSDVEEVIDIFRKTDALDRTREKLSFYLKKARAAALSVSGQKRREGLLGLCDLFEQETSRGS